MRHDLCKFSHSSKHLREAVFQSRWQAAKKSRLARALNWYVCRIRAKEFLAMAVDIIALVIPSDYPGAPSRQQPSHFSHKRTALERLARQAHKELEQDTDRVSGCPLVVPKADIQAAFRYYCWWARVLKFVEHHP